ncbi:hypothetical protein D3C86_1917940 [compost metagenome]
MLCISLNVDDQMINALFDVRCCLLNIIRKQAGLFDSLIERLALIVEAQGIDIA